MNVVKKKRKCSYINTSGWCCISIDNYMYIHPYTHAHTHTDTHTHAHTHTDTYTHTHTHIIQTAGVKNNDTQLKCSNQSHLQSYFSRTLTWKPPSWHWHNEETCPFSYPFFCLDCFNFLLANLALYIIKRLQHIQNFSAGLICRALRSEHTDTWLKQLHWLLIPAHILYKQFSCFLGYQIWRLLIFYQYTTCQDLSTLQMIPFNWPFQN